MFEIPDGEDFHTIMVEQAAHQNAIVCAIENAAAYPKEKDTFKPK